MAHIWVFVGSEWAVLPLNGMLFSLRQRRSLAQQSGESTAWREEVLLIPTARRTELWVLLAGVKADVRINGIRLSLGIRCLRDRDEIRVGGTDLYYFSTESLAVAEPFPGSPPNTFCPRCRQAIAPGDAAVKCPACGVWHHKSEDLPCWTYSETCALCSQVTAMDAGYRWTPEGM
jgi:hypothetical protein